MLVAWLPSEHDCGHLAVERFSVRQRVGRLVRRGAVAGRDGQGLVQPQPGPLTLGLC